MPRLKRCIFDNALRAAKLAEERTLLRALPPTRFPESEEVTVRVSGYSTARVRDCAYSVPARFIGAFLQAQLTEATVCCYRGTAPTLGRIVALRRPVMLAPPVSC